MKLFFCLFSLYIFVLAGVPCRADDDCCAEEAAMNATHPQPHKTDKHPCSPFFACGTCHGFVVPGFDLLLPGRQPEPVLQRAVYKSQPLPDFHTSIWQPPRSIMA